MRKMKKILSKKFFLTITSCAIFGGLFFGSPAVIYAEPDYIIRTMEAEQQQLAAEQDDLKPIFQAPISGQITSRFGYRKSGFHHGLDIANEWGTKVCAIADGVVKEAGWKSSVYGYAVVIDHGNGWQSLYGHCGMLTVKAGQEIKAGDVIAIEGSTGRSTGPHLHLEIKKDGVFLNPVQFIELTAK